MGEIKDMSFEEAMKELEGLVRDLDSGNIPLEQSVALYERGEKLKTHLQAKLDRASLRIQEISAAGALKPASDLEK